MTVSRIDFSALDFLVIEDTTRDMTGAMLRGLGVTQLREARSIEAAMIEIERRPPDIILCDWMNKPRDGLSFLRTLRADPAKPYAHALVIMINAQASSDHIEAALGEGADNYLVKPFSAERLLAHLLVHTATGRRAR